LEKLTEERIQQLKEAKAKAVLGGGEKRIAKLHEQGKLTARERLDVLLDPGSFVEFNQLIGYWQGNPGDGLVCGYGTINGKVVCVYSQDPTVLGGSIGAMHGYKMYRTVERALDMQVPFIGIHDSPGARLPRPQEGTPALGGGMEKNGGSLFYPNTHASGVVPQIAAIVGSCAGISVYSPALTDFIFMVDGTSQMFITGPRMVKSVMGEDVTPEELGGAAVHCTVSGVADARFVSEEDLFMNIRELLSLIPANNQEKPSRIDTGDDPDRLDDELAEIVPANPNKAYDMHELIYRILDNGYFYEIKPEFAGEMIVGFGRLDGQTVGMVANNPLVRAGSLTVDSSDKQARFMRFCDCFNIPIILLVDTPAYMPGTHQEHGGIIRHGAKVLYALCEATVPRIGIMVRKAYGGGNLGMGIIPGMASDMIYMWPSVEIGVLGANQSVELFFGDEIRKAENPKELREQKLKEYREKYANPLHEISNNIFIEDIIEPRETRRRLIQDLKFLENKKLPQRSKKKHGNIPL